MASIMEERLAYRGLRAEAERGLASAEASSDRASIDHWSKRLATVNQHLADLGDADAKAKRQSAKSGVSGGAVRDLWQRALARPGNEAPEGATGGTAARTAWRRALRELPPMPGPIGNQRPEE